MTLVIMQPYFLPYIGYWQLLARADRFVVYDNIQYTKRGWINRNRFLRNGEPVYFTVPLKKASDYLDIAQRSVADDFDAGHMLEALAASYRKAPQFSAVFPVLEKVVTASLTNLFEYVHHSLVVTADYLGIRTPIVISSSVAIDHGLRAEQKVLALCRALGADCYVNPAGGQALYSRAAFIDHGVTLEFNTPRPIQYPQFANAFVPNLSIVDVMMFNSRDAIQTMLGEYDVV